MSKSSCTTGPWRTAPRGDSYTVEGPNPDEPVAQVFTYKRTPGRAEANARLIAAAPTMLWMLRSIMEHYADTEGATMDAEFAERVYGLLHSIDANDKEAAQ